MTVTNMVLLSLSAVDSGPSCLEAGEDCMTSDLTRGLCALWDHRCRQGHSSLFDPEKRSLEELHDVLEGCLREDFSQSRLRFTSIFSQPHCR